MAAELVVLVLHSTWDLGGVDCERSSPAMGEFAAASSVAVRHYAFPPSADGVHGAWVSGTYTLVVGTSRVVLVDRGSFSNESAGYGKARQMHSQLLDRA